MVRPLLLRTVKNIFLLKDNIIFEKYYHEEILFSICQQIAQVTSFEIFHLLQVHGSTLRIHKTILIVNLSSANWKRHHSWRNESMSCSYYQVTFQIREMSLSEWCKGEMNEFRHKHKLSLHQSSPGLLCGALYCLMPGRGLDTSWECRYLEVEQWL